MYKKKNKNSEQKIIIFSGAGISAPSGISTFRDSNGLWENHNIDQICNEYTWKKHFSLVHDFYNQRRIQLKETKPTEGHFLVKKLQEKYKENIINLTQNVDNLFEMAGVENTIHLHGFLPKMECEACGNKWEIGNVKFDIEKDRCPKCNSLKGVRPNIVFFNGQAPMYKKMYNALDYLYNPNSIIVVIGTMGNVILINDLIKSLPCKKILCNMEKSKYINENIFDKVYYESISTASDKIFNNIQQYLEKN